MTDIPTPILYKEDGTEIQIMPNGKKFTLKELISAIDGKIQIIEGYLSHYGDLNYKTWDKLCFVVIEDGYQRTDLNENKKFPKYRGDLLVVHKKYIYDRHIKC